MSGFQGPARRGFAVLLITTLLGGQVAWAQTSTAAQVRESEPGTEEMAADLLIARPIGAAITAVGAAAFLVTLPFTVAGGNVAEAGNALVVGPGRETFVRCLGCRRDGWRGDYEQQ